MTFAYRLTDNWRDFTPALDCVPLVYGSDVCCIGVPVSWTRVGLVWDVWCVISAGEVTGVVPVNGTLISVDDSGTIPIVRDGVNQGSRSYSQTTIARITTDLDPRCCPPRFRVAVGRKVRNLTTVIGVGDWVVNTTTHVAGSAVAAGAFPIPVGPTDEWFSVGPSLASPQTAVDILFDLCIRRPGVGYLNIENTALDWASLRSAKTYITAQGFTLRGQYWGRESLVRLAQRLAAQSGCLLTRRGSRLGFRPEINETPRMLFTSANTNNVRFRFLPWQRHTANTVGSHNCDRVVVQAHAETIPGIIDPSPSEMPADWIANRSSIVALQNLWLDSIRRQDLEVKFDATVVYAQDLLPGDIIQVIHPNLEQSPGERSGYYENGIPSWQSSTTPGQLIYQLNGDRIVGSPPSGRTVPTALTASGTGHYRVTEVKPIDRIRVRITAVIRPPDLGQRDVLILTSQTPK